MIATAFLSLDSQCCCCTPNVAHCISIVDKEEESQEVRSKFGLALLLAIAYAAVGNRKLIGTPPNMVSQVLLPKHFKSSN
jgi:hypothetical protein